MDAVELALSKIKPIKQKMIETSAPQISYEQPSKQGERCFNELTIIAVSGKPRSGKDYLSQYVYNTYQRVVVLPYSQLIIAEANKLLSENNLPTINETNKVIPEARNLLITWGNYRRQQKRTYWTDKLASKIEQLKADADLIFLPGARKESDIEFLANRRHQVWEVIRPQQNTAEIYDPQDRLPIDQAIVNDDNYIDNIEAALSKLRA